MSGPVAWLRARCFRDHSGPRVASLFHRLLGVTFLCAWGSLGSQVGLLIGRRGLLPLAPLLEHAHREGGLPWRDFPTLLRLVPGGPTDGALGLGVALGIGLSLVAIAGVAPRLCAALQIPLYLSYAVACRTFTSFQWDNLLLECALLAAFLPRNRRAPVAHLAFRLLLFKLYFESGIAKWQSHLHDWQDGSAMTFYYETAPLPTRLAWYAHHLPVWWHHVEAWATLALEIVVPFLIALPRAPRRFALCAFTGFQLLDIATANYGFFCYLSLALGAFLLDERDLEPVAGWLRARLRRPPANTPPSPVGPAGPGRKRAAATVGLGLYGAISLAEGLVHFTDSSRYRELIAPAQALWAPLRLINTYHLFGQITRERIEPEFQVSTDGATWQALELRHKPGDPSRVPDFVAPHQPRVDFQLWFYGLSFRQGAPRYVETLVDRLCHDPDAVQPLFRTPLPSQPVAARIGYSRYHFTSAAERRATGRWWTREELGATRRMPCSGARSEEGDAGE